jgi:predicted metalloprotease with PDZ domain
MEGLTSYYDTLLVRRANLISADRYLERMGELLTSMAQTPGRNVQSLADASTCAWIKYYRPDENSANSSVSYYLKGEVVGLLLDLEIRRATQNAKSLDDVMRLLFQRYGDGRGVPEDGIERTAEEVAGTSLRAFFDRAIHSPGELDHGALSWAGLEVRSRVREGASDKGGTPPGKDKDGAPRGWLGATTKSQGERLLVSYPLTGSPAMRDGLYADDELLAVNGFKVEPDKFHGRLEELGPGASVELTVFRRDELKRVKVTLGEKPRDALWIARRDDATEAQKQAFQLWLGEPFKS